MDKARLLIQNYAGVTVVTFQEASILDSNVIDQIAEELYELTDKQHKKQMVLDFSNVKFLASHALGVLITLNKKVQAIKGTLALCSMRKDLMEVFKITRLDKVFNFYKDDTEALKSFGVHVR